jgi:hypothetical protein
MPHDLLLSPDVGHIYGSPGYLDYLIGPPLNWGFELLREGDRRRHHLERHGSFSQPINCPIDLQAWTWLHFSNGP